MEYDSLRTVEVSRAELTACDQILHDLTEDLRSQGDSSRTIGEYLRVAGHIVTWVRSRQIPFCRIGEATDGFLSHLPECHCSAPRPRALRQCRAGLKHLLGVLRRRESIPPAQSPVSECPIDRLLGLFTTHLRQVGGLTDSTVRLYVRYVREFLRTLDGTAGFELCALTVQRVRDYVAEKAAAQQPGTTRSVTSSLKAFFRFTAITGHAPALEGAVPVVSHRRRSTLPKGLSEDQLQELLASYDTSTPIGLRNRAMAVLMARLGLRSQQVSQLKIDQMDWRKGVIHLENGKSRSTSWFPLLEEIGQAVAAYLQRGRPRTPTRFLFVTHSTPAGRALSASAVRIATRRAFQRCGLHVPSYGTHVLRHTLATRLLKAGATLKEIADVLGHRSIETTTVYARVDVAALAEVAMPWPQEVIS